MIRSLVDQLYVDLKERILSGTWQLGLRVFEEEIAKDLEVSRGPIREALRMLEHEGLIVRQAHRGVFVASPDADEVRQVASLRALLEIYAVRWGEPPSAVDETLLEAECAAMEEAVRVDDYLGAVNADMRFHHRVAAHTANEMLKRKYTELDGHIAIFFHSVLSRVPHAAEALAERHRVIARAVGTQDIDKIAQAIWEHYADAANQFSRYAGLKSEGEAPG